MSYAVTSLHAAFALSDPRVDSGCHDRSVRSEGTRARSRHESRADMMECEASSDREDIRLIAATLQGDDYAFADLISRHKKRVISSASRFARDTHQLDDLCQEVFLRVFRNLRHFRGDAPFSHWLARITVSTCYDFLRKEKRVREQVPMSLLEHEVRDAAPERTLAATEAREVLEWAMRQLGADDRMILVLREIEERSVKEICDLTGWSEANVKVRAFRARENLKKLFAKK